MTNEIFEKEMYWIELYEECKKTLMNMAKCENYQFDDLWELSDFVQEVMIIVCEKIQTYDINRSKFATWVKKIGKNVYYDYLRSIRNKAKELSMYIDNDNNEELNIIDTFKYSMSVEDNYFYRISSDKLYNAINNLRDNYRDVVMLCDIEGLKPSEASKVLGIKREDVYRRLNRAHNKLLQFVVSEEIEEDFSYEYEL